MTLNDMNYVDSHCHLYDTRGADLDDVIASARAAGVSKMITGNDHCEAGRPRGRAKDLGIGHVSCRELDAGKPVNEVGYAYFDGQYVFLQQWHRAAIKGQVGARRDWRERTDFNAVARLIYITRAFLSHFMNRHKRRCLVVV